MVGCTLQALLAESERVKLRWMDEGFSRLLLKYLSYFTHFQVRIRAGLGIWVSLLCLHGLGFLQSSWAIGGCCVILCQHYTKDHGKCPLSLGLLQTRIRAEHLLLSILDFD